MKKHLAVCLAACLVALIAVGTISQAVQSQGSILGKILGGKAKIIDGRHNAPIAIVGDNMYIAWWTNKTGNDEVQIRASTDGGATFGDKVSLSNSSDAESQDIEIAAEGDNVIVTWWERNQTAEEPVARISTDNGATFGPVLTLATNGTLGEA